MENKLSKSVEKRVENLNRAGRKAGVPNKSTTELKQAIAAFTSRNAEKIDIWLNEIDDPAKRLDLYFKALEYTMPKLARSEVVGDEKAPVKIQVTWKKP